VPKCESGIGWVAVCDRFSSLKVAGGLSGEVMEKKIKAMATLNQKNKYVHVLCGTKVDITAGGALEEYPTETYSAD
jgi:hypothetical protein